MSRTSVLETFLAGNPAGPHHTPGTDTATADTGAATADLDDYAALQAWSVAHPAAFWESVRSFFGIELGGVGHEVIAPSDDPRVFSGRQFYRGTTLNYVDTVLRHAADRPDVVAVIDDAEPGGADTRTVTWRELVHQVSVIAAALRARGVGRGDRVAGYVPNTVEAAIAFLATASLGAVWTSCGQDYSAAAAADRLGQTEPTVLVTADGYRFAGKDRDRRDAVAELQGAVPSLTHVIAFSRLGTEVPGATGWTDLLRDGARTPTVEPEAVPFDHPLWILFSSGTTGKPKGIVHGHGGVVLEHVKSAALQSDIGPDDVFFWYTSPSWMMWNYLLAGLLCGATVVCYDGSPAAPETGTLWALAARHRVTVLGTSPAYLAQCETAGVEPGRDHDLGRVRMLGVTGSVMPASAHTWVADHVGEHVHVASISGGTDVVSAFVCAPTGVPVHPGEIPAVALGVALEAWNDRGESVIGESGEMVITAPMPSMPVGFWNDPSGDRYADAYFSTFPGVWRHGDSVTVTDRGGVVIHGRSDATLNRNGIRMGSADIYSVVEHLPDVEEALVVGIERADGSYWMPLFVVPAPGREVDDALREAIATALRTEASPRHVPDDIVAIPAVPHTRTGKKLEIPVKKVLLGGDPNVVADPESIDDPAALRWFGEYAASTLSGSGAS
ncbi:acetoacetate--CoA ligase [Rhodococcoides corynebacterioides]|uniref:Acetoacetate--CoA ligase n=1 Tax=Rhodococcoides corynebacterioides TaxID=53972 RepID=A0ABS7PBP9_9NOCA|nr:acetoacetate--CoA ligase [Rhodococcus corynebacterioides]MBY6368601.1 acetoacetate--CoA ligase [Rhodococcus corynebacterioides]MBY6409582.1 acetoacetate--CoA ligase [Rhodococcus corynebacterioides]